MKKLLLITALMLIITNMFGMKHRGLSHREISDAIDYAIIEELKEAGYTVLPEVIVQDTLNRKKSNYEKYWEEREKNYFQKIEKFKEDNAKVEQDTVKPENDDLYYTPEKKGRWFFEKKDPRGRPMETESVVVNNNYYYDDNDFYYANRINRFHGGFWFNYSPFYSPYYGWNSPYFYDSWYWGYNSYWYDWYYPYYGFGWHYPIYSPYYSWNYPYYNHQIYRNPTHGVGVLGNRYYGYNQRTEKSQVYNPMGRRTTTSTLSQTRTINQSQERRVVTSPQDKSSYSESKRSYSPSYQQPRMSTRPQYNNTRTGNMNTRTEISTQRRTETRTSNPSGGDRPIYSRPSTNGRPAYSAPQQRSSNSYSQPSRGSSYQSAPSMNRSSGNSYSAPSRSSGSSFSGNGNSGSYGGGSSSGSKSGGRR